MPEPGPVGVNVDPLGEPLGASVLPDGFVLLGPIRPEFTEPVDVPAVPPVVFPLNDEPVVVPPVTEPPAEPPPAVPPLLCASANVLVSASAPANAIVVIRMVFFPYWWARINQGRRLVFPRFAPLDHNSIRVIGL
jgi:hypothetical protein